MNAEAYMKSKLDGSFVSWKPNNGVFNRILVPVDYLPPYHKRIGDVSKGNVKKSPVSRSCYSTAYRMLKQGSNASNCAEYLRTKFNIAWESSVEIVAQVRREHGFKPVRGER